MANTQEKVLYFGGPSQWVNLGIFAGCALLLVGSILAPTLWETVFVHHFPHNKGMYMVTAKVLFVLSIFWAFRAWLRVKCHKYKITSERLMESSGIFSRVTSELELFRVKDLTFHEPFWIRMWGCGNIVLDTSDKSTPIVVLHGLKNPRPVLELLRRNVMEMRTRRGVRELDM